MSRLSVSRSAGASGNTDRFEQGRARGEQLGRADRPARRGCGRREPRQAFPDPLVVTELPLQHQAFDEARPGQLVVLLSDRLTWPSLCNAEAMPGVPRSSRHSPRLSS